MSMWIVGMVALGLHSVATLLFLSDLWIPGGQLQEQDFNQETRLWS